MPSCNSASVLALCNFVGKAILADHNASGIGLKAEGCSHFTLEFALLEYDNSTIRLPESVGLVQKR